MCPRCKEEDEIPDHILFRCQTIKRVKYVEGRGRRQSAAEDEMRWDSWDALALKKWARRESISLEPNFYISVAYVIFCTP